MVEVEPWQEDEVVSRRRAGGGPPQGAGVAPRIVDLDADPAAGCAPDVAEERNRRHAEEEGANARDRVECREAVAGEVVGVAAGRASSSFSQLLASEEPCAIGHPCRTQWRPPCCVRGTVRYRAPFVGRKRTALLDTPARRVWVCAQLLVTLSRPQMCTTAANLTGECAEAVHHDTAIASLTSPSPGASSPTRR